MIKDKILSFFQFPYEKDIRDQLELGLISLNYKSERFIAYTMLILQLFMILIFSIRSGGIFYSRRRFCYVLSYTVLCLSLLLLLLIHKRSQHNWRLHTRICILFGIVLALWVSSISYLDSLGELSIVVYCSFLPMMAVFLILPPYIISMIFIFTCVLTDMLVLSTPYGKENLFSTLINSIFICVLSVIYSTRLYHARLTEIYDKIIIEQKNEQLEAANKKLDQLSMTDALTSLGNRRYLEEAIRIPLEKYGIHMGSLSVMLLDIDFFKQYNDIYGHLQGDYCLQAVSAILSESAEKSPFRAVRYGGEEFVLVITGKSSEQVFSIAEHIRTMVEANKISGPEIKDTSVTISIGISFREHWESGLLDTTISEADQALYRAKQKGRNRTEMFNNPG